MQLDNLHWLTCRECKRRICVASTPCEILCGSCLDLLVYTARMFGCCPELVALHSKGEENRIGETWKVYQWRQNVVDNIGKLQLELYNNAKVFVKKKSEA